MADHQPPPPTMVNAAPHAETTMSHRRSSHTHPRPPPRLPRSPDVGVRQQGMPHVLPRRNHIQHRNPHPRERLHLREAPRPAPRPHPASTPPDITVPRPAASGDQRGPPGPHEAQIEPGPAPPSKPPRRASAMPRPRRRPAPATLAAPPRRQTPRQPAPTCLHPATQAERKQRPAATFPGCARLCLRSLRRRRRGDEGTGLLGRRRLGFPPSRRTRGRRGGVGGAPVDVVKKLAHFLLRIKQMS